MKVKGQICVIGNVPTSSELTQALRSQGRGKKVEVRGRRGRKGTWETVVGRGRETGRSVTKICIGVQDPK